MDMTRCWKSGNQYALALEEVAVEEACFRGRGDDRAEADRRDFESSAGGYAVAVFLEALEEGLAA